MQSLPTTTPVSLSDFLTPSAPRFASPNAKSSGKYFWGLDHSSSSRRENSRAKSATSAKRIAGGPLRYLAVTFDEVAVAPKPVIRPEQYLIAQLACKLGMQADSFVAA